MKFFGNSLFQEFVATEGADNPPAYRRLMNRLGDWIERNMKNPWVLLQSPTSKFSKVDIYSRRIFPLSFFMINTIYWTSFMYIEGDQAPVLEDVQVQIIQ